MSYRSSNPRGNHSSEANSSNRHGASAALTDWQQFGPGYQVKLIIYTHSFN